MHSTKKTDSFLDKYFPDPPPARDGLHIPRAWLQIAGVVVLVLLSAGSVHAYHTALDKAPDIIFLLLS